MNSAVISDCGLFRYRLDRDVQAEGKVFAYFGVNPSTADHEVDDHTVKKWIGFTLRNGGRKFIVGNVFSYRDKNVKALANAEACIGAEHNFYINQIIQEADVLVPCWGDAKKVPLALRGELNLLMQVLIESGKPVLHFGRTVGGDPLHPLKLAYATPLVAWA